MYKKCMLGFWNSLDYFDNNKFDLFYWEGLWFEFV